MSSHLRDPLRCSPNRNFRAAAAGRQHRRGAEGVFEHDRAALGAIQLLSAFERTLRYLTSSEICLVRSSQRLQWSYCSRSCGVCVICYFSPSNGVCGDTDLYPPHLNSGPQLRLDGPSALKDIIGVVQTKLVGRNDKLSSRTRFMIETLTNLKTLRSNAWWGSGIRAVPIVAGEEAARAVRTHEPYRVSLEDSRTAESKGKWWLIGGLSVPSGKLQGPLGQIGPQRRRLLFTPTTRTWAIGIAMALDRRRPWMSNLGIATPYNPDSSANIIFIILATGLICWVLDPAKMNRPTCNAVDYSKASDKDMMLYIKA
ncbi:hypothetical protein FIBSPDRAFT_889986 [Athelia psychrophila]|uniref:Uncharacterized protein n=1 Tax=Athelia psychrophila TaxID=1759441 RepID=A0A166LEB3_9AGAM|nr:hypothetical protein FIBSPDRAFT_889986 [Fibularhizoctonia sp. CBS 109695]